jgi:exopolysaccharide production protein ExoQ
VLMNLGLVGLFIVLLQVAFTLHAMITDKDTDQKSVAIGLFIPAIINSFTEFGIFGETNYGIMFYLFIVFMYGMKVNNSAFGSYKVKQYGHAEKNSIHRPAFTA